MGSHCFGRTAKAAGAAGRWERRLLFLLALTRTALAAAVRTPGHRARPFTGGNHGSIDTETGRPVATLFLFF